MPNGKTIDQQQFHDQVEAWRTTAIDKLIVHFQVNAQRIRVFTLQEQPLAELIGAIKAHKAAGLRLHPGLQTSGDTRFSLLAEVVDDLAQPFSGNGPYFELAFTTREIPGSDDLAVLAPGQIQPNEARLMHQLWLDLPAESIPEVLQNGSGTLRYLTFTADSTASIISALDTYEHRRLFVFLAVKHPDLQEKYEDDSEFLFTFIVEMGSLATVQNDNPSNVYFDWGKICPPYC